MANKRRDSLLENTLVHVRENIYRVPYRRKNGLPANKYYMKVPCSVCGKDCYQGSSNSRRGHKPVCSKDCQYNHKVRKEKIKKPRANGEYHIQVLVSDHPCRDRHGRVYEHRLVMERRIGRILKKNERVHHINMIKHDNREDNLWLFDNHTKHFEAHGSLNRIVASLIDKGAILFDREKEEYRLVDF